MWQNGVAPSPSQRNELISPRFQWAFFHFGKRAFFGLDRKRVTVPHSEWGDGEVDRAAAAAMLKPVQLSTKDALVASFYQLLTCFGLVRFVEVPRTKS